MPANQISVNLGSYQKFREGALAHLASIGVRWVEIAAPAPDQVEATRARLAEHGMTAATLLARCDLTEEPEAMRDSFAGGQALGVSRFFISTRAGELPKPEAYRRLRARAELAAEYGVTLCFETHPDLGENVGEARATLHAVGHPNLRWNLDTANLYYYNIGVDAVDQAARGADLIGSVHLKDTNGATRCWWFPALGEGVVDFAGVFRALNRRGFFGPFTLELEGVQGESLDETEVHKRVARSIGFLRAIGVSH